mgnify:CR=1 FL=1
MVVRGIVAAMKQENLLDALLVTASPPVRALLEQPPLAGAWVEGSLLDAFTQEFTQRFGEEKHRQIQKRAIAQGPMLIIRPLVEAAFRVTGTSPNTLLERFHRISSASVRGTSYAYTRTGPTSGILTAVVDGFPPPTMAVGMMAAVDFLFELCGVVGHVATPEFKRGADTTTLTLELSWR